MGPLAARVAGSGEVIVLLLHGQRATGEMFGASYDSLAARYRLVVPDLLGFGRSVGDGRSRFDPDDHLDALDELLRRADGADRPVVVAGHSMGAALALRWAARHPERAAQVVCWGAPMYREVHSLRAAAARTDLLARLATVESSWANRLGASSCRHPGLTGWLTTAISPELPVPIARSRSSRTWDAYRRAVTGLVVETDWRSLAAGVADAGVPIRLVWGESDPLGNRALARALARSRPTIVVETVGGAGPDLPISHPSACIAHLVDAARRRP